MRYTHSYSASAFSIIEILIGIFVFSLGLISIYALLSSSVSVWAYNKNTIIASNLAREQIELFFHLRDTNYKKLQIWDKKDPYTLYDSDIPHEDQTFNADTYYSLSPWLEGKEVSIYEFPSVPPEGREKIQEMHNTSWYKICIQDNAYMPCSWESDEKKTFFFRYLYISDTAEDGSSLPEGSYRLVSKVIWKARNYHEYDISTIITDWRRI